MLKVLRMPDRKNSRKLENTMSTPRYLLLNVGSGQIRNPSHQAGLISIKVMMKTLS